MASPKHYWGILCRRQLKDGSVDEYWEGVQYHDGPDLYQTKKDAEKARAVLCVSPFWSKVIKWECPTMTPNEQENGHG